MNLFRIALALEYDGSCFYGWQIQKQGITVQGELEKALSKIANHPVQVTAAGRTDRGVHSTEQIVHFDTSVDRSNRAWVFGANAELPKQIRVLWTVVVDNNFNARRSAIARRYQYFTYNHSLRPALLSKQVTWFYRPLDADTMHKAAQIWLGEHDFSSFRAAECQSKSPIRHVKAVSVKRMGDLIIFDIVANAFLHHMVRNMMGVLFAIGTGERTIAWAKDVLLEKNRHKAGVTAPPNGLYLTKVEYSANYEFPQLEVGPWFFCKT